MKPEDVQKEVLQSKDQLVRLLRAVAHGERLHVLALLVKRQQEFSSLLEETGLSKTALANHLSKLIDGGLIERLERGIYQVTIDGKEFLESLTATYSSSQMREELAKQQLLARYTRGYGSGGELKMEEYVVEKKATYEPAWISYVAAMTGVLKSLGVECDVVDVAGYSGYAFIVNVSKGTTCPSGPTAHGAWDGIHEGTEVLGWRISSVGEEVSYPQGETVTSEDLERARKHFEIVKKGLTSTGRPVILWGIPLPEYGIVNGYSGDAYEVSTYRHLHNEPETPIRYDALQAPGCLEAILFDERIRIPDESDGDAGTVKRAIEMAEGAYALKAYVAGPDAYEEWARVLEEKPGDVIYHGNSYVAACTQEGKACATEFLKRVDDKYQEKPQAPLLKKAMEEYKQASQLMEDYVKVFPFAMEGDLPSDKLSRGADILRNVKSHEENALGYMKQAVKVWE